MHQLDLQDRPAGDALTRRARVRSGEIHRPSPGRDGWWFLAACRGLPFEVFFPPEEAEREGAWTPEPALAVCARCPVRAFCRREALANHETEGVWGGLSPEELGRCDGRAWSQEPEAREIRREIVRSGQA